MYYNKTILNDPQLDVVIYNYKYTFHHKNLNELLEIYTFKNNFTITMIYTN